MDLRSHPLMSFGGRHSWPPVWTWIGGSRDRYLNGEIGMLKEVRMPDAPGQKCYLVIEHEDTLYMGCLFIGDHAFCREIFQLLQNERGHSIEHIGGLDLSYLS
jgi:hypothetical protein